MTILDPRRNKKSNRDYRQVGILAAVPALLLAGPLIGYFGGHWADGKFGTEPYLAAAGAILGLVSAGLEICNLVKKASAIGKEKDSE